MEQVKSAFFSLVIAMMPAKWKNSEAWISTLTPQFKPDYDPSRVRNNLGTTN
jgi:hypothetical protein